MSRRSWLGLALICVVAVAIAVAIDQAVASGHDDATIILSIPILIVAVLTLRFTAPKPAKIVVDRLDEAELTDLLFFIHTLPGPEDEQQPVDYLFQLHVAVSNLGERKAILSAIRIEGFRTGREEVVHLPNAPERIGGMRWVQQSGWVNDRMHFQNISDPPPYVLDRDDAIVIRFRVRRGIDWGEQWTLEALRSFTEPLRYPIVSAFGTVIWRRAGEVIRERFDVDLKVEQQAEYVAAAERLTRGFCAVPNVPLRPFQLE